MATTGIWGDISANVACGGLAEVSSVLPPGADPHAFEPSLADRATVDGAAVVVANGLGLEESLEEMLSDVEGAGTPVVAVGEHIQPLGEDPHLWFDPRRVAEVVPVIAEALVDAGLDADAVGACVEEYEQELDALDIEMERVLADVPDEKRELVTNHDALAYFADRYDFEIIGTVIPGSTSLAEPSPRDLVELAEIIRDHDVVAIFAEELESAADADALSERLDGVKVETLYTDALGEPGSGADTYVGLMRTDARLIAAALGG